MRAPSWRRGSRSGASGTIPWRAREAERVLVGARPDAAALAAAARAALVDPYTVPGTAFKVPLAERTIVRILQDLAEAAA